MITEDQVNGAIAFARETWRNDGAEGVTPQVDDKGVCPFENPCKLHTVVLKEASAIMGSSR